MTPKQIDQRIIKSRRMLAEWAREDTELSRAQTIAEIGVLESLLVTAPVEKQAKIRTLIERFTDNTMI